jgi:two-component system sensor histidine kinase and response regulator WspE
MVLVIYRILGRIQSDRESPSTPIIVTEAVPVLSLDDAFPDDEETADNSNQSSEIINFEAANDQENSAVLVSRNGEVSQTLNSPVSNFSVSDSLSYSLQEKDRFVRVSADNLNRLMGLAGKSLLEAKALEPFADSMVSLKKS